MEYQLKELLSPYSEKNTANLYEPVAVGKYGIRKRSEIYKKELADDYSKNKVIYKDTLTIGLGSKQIDFGVLTKDGIYSVSPAYSTFRINTKVVKSEYLALYFSAFNEVLTGKYMIASARQGKKVDINNMLLDKVVIPDFDTQERIISEVDFVKEAKALCEQQLSLYDELIKARFVELFGDPITNTKHLETKDLRDVLVLKAGDFTAASDISDEQTETHKYPCYGGNGIRGYVEEHNQEGEYSLIGRQGALSGNVQFARGQFKNTEHALLVTPLIEMNSIWLNQLLINLDLKRYQTGAAQPGLSVKNLQEIQILTVSLEDQNAFADFVEQVDKSKVVEMT